MAYPSSFDPEEDDFNSIIGGTERKISRPFSIPSSPKGPGMMTPGDFGTLQEGLEGVSMEDYFAWRLPAEEDDAEDYYHHFPVQLKKRSNPGSDAVSLAGDTNGQ
ncbi:hypothetical protein KEM55_002644 [Ascosphaera atra]|nr:hypothetical protein KEM55_002644 [Ascosphaera atra]